MKKRYSEEPFDFLTWFEFASSDASAFDGVLGGIARDSGVAFRERETEVLER